LRVLRASESMSAPRWSALAMVIESGWSSRSVGATFFV
jgi:hypothetical protein